MKHSKYNVECATRVTIFDARTGYALPKSIGRLPLNPLLLSEKLTQPSIRFAQGVRKVTARANRIPRECGHLL